MYFIIIFANGNKYEHTTPFLKQFRALKFNDIYIVYLTSAIMLFIVYVKDVPVNIQKKWFKSMKFMITIQGIVLPTRRILYNHK